MNSGNTPFSETDVITISELAKRLKVRRERVYDIVAEPGCPVYDMGGERQRRIIWGDFLDWYRLKYRVASDK
ncbi:hypothetical protein C2I18_14150 [Paenibacillus sp. PK3_47]|uniref:E2F family transcription factor n=1 Tax=Paenibacillus sp. PK3_47 TaxID=2072642 RepID=UPI00201DF59B|nr:E2F family transcription factor [Paenibacillus sp. PK3_47]UQZ34560.1 hypothetical protein C2I18_14150 [Paenibacillus sp. PK3_47]